MNFLAPLFLAGAAAIAVPILLHLIRRTEREKLPFSSLMFLQSTPPQITRRSRLENIFLLLLRCLAFALIAMAFARPYLQQAMNATTPSTERRRSGPRLWPPLARRSISRRTNWPSSPSTASRW
jgi:hypothetical protein